jgi:hypothetical protein
MAHYSRWRTPYYGALLTMALYSRWRTPYYGAPESPHSLSGPQARQTRQRRGASPQTVACYPLPAPPPPPSRHAAMLPAPSSQPKITAGGGGDTGVHYTALLSAYSIGQDYLALLTPHYEALLTAHYPALPTLSTTHHYSPPTTQHYSALLSTHLVPLSLRIT